MAPRAGGGPAHPTRRAADASPPEKRATARLFLDIGFSFPNELGSKPRATERSSPSVDFPDGARPRRYRAFLGRAPLAPARRRGAPRAGANAAREARPGGAALRPARYRAVARVLVVEPRLGSGPTVDFNLTPVRSYAALLTSPSLLAACGSAGLAGRLPARLPQPTRVL